MTPKPGKPAATPLPAPVQLPDIAAAYQQVFDILKSAYWEASDIDSKDLITGVSHAIGDILTQLDEDDLETNTQAFLALTSQLKSVNIALAEIQKQVNTITRNITTAAALTSAIAKAMSLAATIL